MCIRDRCGTRAKVRLAVTKSGCTMDTVASVPTTNDVSLPSTNLLSIITHIIDRRTQRGAKHIRVDHP